MERFRLTILAESRIRWKVYVRFGGEYWETYHRNMTRRRVLSLHNQAVKELRCHFSEKKAMALLYRLEKCTIDLVKLSREIVELSRDMRTEWERRQE